LLVVEGIGDMVLRNGQRIVCLKMRRDPAMGLDNTDYSWSDQNTWYAPQPSNQGDMYAGLEDAYGNGMYGRGTNPYAVQGLAPLPDGVRQSATASQGIMDVMADMPCEDSNPTQLPMADIDNIAIELGQGSDVVTLENMWENIRSKNQKLLKGYNPYYSIDTIAEGGVPELFRLRVGPVKDIKTGDEICAKLSKKGVTCSVIRTQ